MNAFEEFWNGRRKRKAASWLSRVPAEIVAHIACSETADEDPQIPPVRITGRSRNYSEMDQRNSTIHTRLLQPTQTVTRPSSLFPLPPCRSEDKRRGIAVVSRISLQLRGSWVISVWWRGIEMVVGDVQSARVARVKRSGWTQRNAVGRGIAVWWWLRSWTTRRRGAKRRGVKRGQREEGFCSSGLPVLHSQQSRYVL